MLQQATQASMWFTVAIHRPPAETLDPNPCTSNNSSRMYTALLQRSMRHSRSRVRHMWEVVGSQGAKEVIWRTRCTTIVLRVTILHLVTLYQLIHIIVSNHLRLVLLIIRIIWTPQLWQWSNTRRQPSSRGVYRIRLVEPGGSSRTLVWLTSSLRISSSSQHQ